MFRLLQELVLIQSSTHNKAGVDQVGYSIERALRKLPLRCQRVSEHKQGDHLIFSTAAADTGRRSILITGHMDTVFPEDTLFHLYRSDENKVYGPGVIDMKGGLVVTIFAVQALAAAGVLEQVPLTLLFNSDEEIGSPTSIPVLKKLAQTSCCALVTECGGMQGEVVLGRKGKLGLQVNVHGKAGHAAFAQTEKASAVLELAKKIIQFEECNDPARGVIVNVGKVAGGISQNTVAEEAIAFIDTRYCTKKDGRQLRKRLEIICEKNTTPGTWSELSITNERPIMEANGANRVLFDRVKKEADRLGIQIKEEVRQGASDANTLAGEGLPVLDGLGPFGEFDHSDQEYMVKQSLVERGRLLAASILSIARSFEK